MIWFGFSFCCVSFRPFSTLLHLPCKLFSYAKSKNAVHFVSKTWLQPDVMHQGRKIGLFFTAPACLETKYYRIASAVEKWYQKLSWKNNADGKYLSSFTVAPTHTSFPIRDRLGVGYRVRSSDARNFQFAPAQNHCLALSTKHKNI